ncbi:hypothetical protein M5K25_001714 [Dendrobium thyrsiflorum]|uniref:Uncharacterized protein n=1 Tax=Dendrobium thyrsiflorum TaxID=117978 RepID=A0ABD0W3P2_DENTH
MVAEWMMDSIKFSWFPRPRPSWSLFYLVRGGRQPNLIEGSLSVAIGCIIQEYLASGKRIKYLELTPSIEIYIQHDHNRDVIGIPINSTAALRAFIQARSPKKEDDQVASPPAKSDTPRNTITGIPEAIAVCKNIREKTKPKAPLEDSNYNLDYQTVSKCDVLIVESSVSTRRIQRTLRLDSKAISFGWGDFGGALFSHFRNS